MLKKVIVLLAMVLIYNLTFACDLCSIYIGLDPNGTKNSFGVRHRYRAFEKTYLPNLTGQLLGNRLISTINSTKGVSHDKHGPDDDDLNSGEDFVLGETYNSYDIFANFYLNHRLQINLNTYFSDNFILNNDSIVANAGGIGDVSAVIKYSLYNTKKSSDSLKNKWLNRVIVGGGISLPTGKFNKTSIVDFETEFTSSTIIQKPIEELDPHIQAGTGSLGYLFLIEHMIRYNRFGWNSNISYRHNATNRNGFRFANRFNANGSLFLVSAITKKITFYKRWLKLIY